MRTWEKNERIQSPLEKEGLDDLLPEAFAVVKNAARRLCGQNLEVCGHANWEMVHYDVQLLGGITLHERIAEMATGGGKPWFPPARFI